MQANVIRRFLSLALIASCSDATWSGLDGGPATSSLYLLSIAINPATIRAGEMAQATARVVDLRGNPVVREIRWSTTDSTVATIDRDGRVLGLAAGALSVRALVGTVFASTPLVIQPASAPQQAPSPDQNTEPDAPGTPPDTTGTPPDTTAAPSDTVPSGSTGGFSGTVATATGAPVGGGVVEVLVGSRVVRVVNVSSSGSYSTSDLQPGDYTLKLHPPLKHSLGPSEPDQRPITVTSGQSASAPTFIVQDAIYADDFQSYSTAQLLGGAGYSTGNIPPGYFWSGPNRDIQIAHPDWISMDATGGPFGDRAARYDWPANPHTGGDLSTYCGSGPTVALIPRVTPPPTGLRNLWVRFTSKESPRFEHGSSACMNTAALAYKFFLVQVYSGSTFAQFGTYLANSVQGEPLPTALVIGATDRASNQMGSKSLGGSGTSFGGQWHTYVMEILGIGTTNSTLNLYMDGVLQLSVTAPILPGQTIGPGWALALDIGSIINNGPDHAQSRWFRELGVYTTRPSMRPLVP